MFMKEAIIFTLGIGLGGLLGYKYAEKKLTDLNEKDISELKAYYNSELKDKIAKTSEKMDEIADKLTELDESETVMREQNSSDNSVNSNENAEWPEKVEEIKKKSSKKSKKQAPDEKRTIISSEEFLEDNDFDKETLYYYEEDETFCTPEYEVLPDAIDLIGKENLDNVGMFEDGVLYVRNELYGKDIEVIFYEGAYSDMIDSDEE